MRQKSAIQRFPTSRLLDQHAQGVCKQRTSRNQCGPAPVLLLPPLCHPQVQLGTLLGWDHEELQIVPTDKVAIALSTENTVAQLIPDSFQPSHRPARKWKTIMGGFKQSICKHGRTRRPKLIYVTTKVVQH